MERSVALPIASDRPTHARYLFGQRGFNMHGCQPQPNVVRWLPDSLRRAG
jgi:hypothetical protein